MKKQAIGVMLVLMIFMLTPPTMAADKSTIFSVDKFSEEAKVLSVEKGTGIENIEFPRLTANEGKLVLEDISWKCDNYKKDIVGEYSFEPEISSQKYILNEGIEIPQITVAIIEQRITEDLTEKGGIDAEVKLVKNDDNQETTSACADSQMMASENKPKVGVLSYSINSTMIGFAGHEWWVIGDSGGGVIAPTKDCVTLLSKNNDFGRKEFWPTPKTIMDDLSGEYCESVLRKTMGDLANTFAVEGREKVRMR